MKKHDDVTHDISLLMLVIVVILTTGFLAEQILWKLDHDCRNCTIHYKETEPYR